MAWFTKGPSAPTYGDDAFGDDEYINREEFTRKGKNVHFTTSKGQEYVESDRFRLHELNRWISKKTGG